MLVSGVLLFELVLVAIFAGLLGRSDQALDENHLALSVISHIDRVRSFLTDLEVSAQQPDAGGQCQRDLDGLKYEFDALALFFRDDPDAVRQLNGLHNDIIWHAGRLRATSNQPAAFDYQQFERSREIFGSRLDGIVARYRRPTTEFVVDRATISRRLTQSNILIVILINAVVAVGTTLYFMQGIVNRLGVVADNSVRFGRGEELNPPLEGTDEIAALDRILHETIRQRTLVESLLKESEARTRSLIENMPVGVVTIEPSGVIESINPRTEQIFGYSFDELMGDHIVALFSLPPDAESNQFMEMLYQKVLGRVAKFESRRKNGEIFPIEMTLNEFDSIDGKRYLAIIQDITEREKAERFKQELIAMVSHDLRSPLTSVQGVMTLLGRGMYGQLNDTGEKRVKAAEQSLIRLVRLVDDILDLERMEAGRLQFNPEPVALSSLVDRSIELVYDFAAQSQISFDTFTGDQEIFVDEDRVVQVLVNLLSNAIKFSPANSQIAVSAETYGDEVEIRVTDQGPGIAEEHRDTIFDRFHQVDGVSSEHKGTGLGLAICKAIVEGHGGTMGVRSQVGKGSTFWFRVPKRPDATAITVQAGERKAGQLAIQ
jgi:PAS domain S-box-containing protein